MNFSRVPRSKRYATVADPSGTMQDVAMGTFILGGLASVPSSQRPELLAEKTRIALERAGLLEQVGVVEIDPTISDTEATRQSFGLEPDALANCVVVGGRREGEERVGACVVLATTRADVNGVVRRLLDVRKASFLPVERAVALSEMEYGGITPIGLPENWPLFVDSRVVSPRIVVIGSGVRRSKLLLPGEVLSRLPNARIVNHLGV